MQVLAHAQTGNFTPESRLEVKLLQYNIKIQTYPQQTWITIFAQQNLILQFLCSL
jgi:hypothetical protein